MLIDSFVSLYVFVHAKTIPCSILNGIINVILVTNTMILESTKWAPTSYQYGSNSTNRVKKKLSPIYSNLFGHLQVLQHHS